MAMFRYYHDLEKRIQQDQDQITNVKQVHGEVHGGEVDGGEDHKNEEDPEIIEISPGVFAKRLTSVKHVFTRSQVPRSETVRVRITVVSPEWIRKVSVCEIVNNIPQGKNNGGKREGTLEDHRLQPRDRFTPCATCFKHIEDCPGHRAYIPLPLPSYNILYMDTIIQILRCVCFFCSRPLLEPTNPRFYKLLHQPHQMKRLSEQANFSKTIEYCGGPPPAVGVAGSGSSSNLLDFSKGCHNRQPLYSLKKKNKLMIVVHRRPPETKKKTSSKGKKRKNRPDSPTAESPKTEKEWSSDSPSDRDFEQDLEHDPDLDPGDREQELDPDQDPDQDPEQDPDQDMYPDTDQDPDPEQDLDQEPYRDVEHDSERDYDLGTVEDEEQETDGVEDTEEAEQLNDEEEEEPVYQHAEHAEHAEGEQGHARMDVSGGSHGLHAHAPCSTSIKCKVVLDTRLLLDPTPSLKKNLEWSKLESLLPTNNNLFHIIPLLFPSSKSSRFPLES